MGQIKRAPEFLRYLRVPATQDWHRARARAIWSPVLQGWGVLRRLGNREQVARSPRGPATWRPVAMARSARSRAAPWGAPAALAAHPPPRPALHSRSLGIPSPDTRRNLTTVCLAPWAAGQMGAKCDFQDRMRTRWLPVLRAPRRTSAGQKAARTPAVTAPHPAGRLALVEKLLRRVFQIATRRNVGHLH